MPQLANITIKKNDGTTDITYTGVAASAGDTTPAVWQSLTVGAASAHRPEFRVTARPNGSKSARRVTLDFTYPEVVTGTDGIPRIVDRVVFTASAVKPLGMSDVTLNEAMAQISNLMGSTLVKDMLKSGFSAT